MNHNNGPIGRLKLGQHINIVGGGISGLAMGFFFKKNNIPFSILEASDSLGGKIKTKKFTSGIAEQAANAIYADQLMLDIIEELNLDFQFSTPKLKRKIWRNNKAVSPPLSIFEIIKLIPNLFKKIPSKKDQETISVYDFFLPFLGAKLCEEVLSPALSGIYATHAKELHFASIFNPKESSNYLSFFKEMRKKKKENKILGKSLSFEGGMSDMILALEEYLKDHIQYGVKVDEINPNENYLICTDALAASEILRFDSSISSLLKKVEYVPISATTIHSSIEIPFLDKSFGILFPKTNQHNVMGILNNKAIFQSRVASDEIYSYTYIIKLDHKNCEFNQDIENNLNNLNFISKESTIHQSSSKWARGIPKYNLNRSQIMMKLRVEFEKKSPGIAIFGNYVDKISIREIFGTANKFSQNLIKELS